MNAPEHPPGVQPAGDDDALVLYGQRFESRLLLGTSRYPSPAVLQAAVQRAKPAMLTASLRRQTGAAAAEASQGFWQLLQQLKVPVLPNTAGCHSLQEVIATAEMAREVFETDWIKLELIGDDYTLQPDTLKLPEAADRLLRAGFKVLPYCTEDLVLCQRLVDVGCQAVMPWAAPIGTGQGPVNPYAMRTLRDRLDVPMIVDAGLGLPSHACQVLEWGYDAVLLNTAVALAQ
ncbi:MAG: thiazole synthase, partial [Rubrivivax sp.]